MAHDLQSILDDLARQDEEFEKMIQELANDPDRELRLILERIERDRERERLMIAEILSLEDSPSPGWEMIGTI